jgi:CRISPR type III-B/RAMP module RAMP protein Cmr1
MASSIIKLEMENLTHAIPGGFNAAPYSSELDVWELPRAQSLKGLWRWWLRALLGGALWEGGIYDERKVKQTTKALLGSTEQASKFLIHASAEGRAEPMDDKAVREWRKGWKAMKIPLNDLFPWISSPHGAPWVPPLPPRLRILLLASKEKEDEKRLAEKISCYQPGSLRISIELLRRPHANVSPEECSIAASSLLLSLVFGGVGASTRRGFGSLSFKHVEASEELQEHKELVDGIAKADEPNEVSHRLHQLVERSLSAARKLLGVDEVRGPNEVPSHPLLSEPGDPPERVVRPFNLAVFKLSTSSVKHASIERAFQLLEFEDREAMKLLTIIGYSTTRLAWELTNEKQEPDILSYRWVMGLPRGREEDGKKTGYWLDGELGRRASAISVKPVKRLGGDSWIVSLYGFLSRDWYDKLHHYGARKREISPLEHVAEAFTSTWSKLKQIYGMKQWA